MHLIHYPGVLALKRQQIRARVLYLVISEGAPKPFEVIDPAFANIFIF